MAEERFRGPFAMAFLFSPASQNRDRSCPALGLAVLEQPASDDLLPVRDVDVFLVRACVRVRAYVPRPPALGGEGCVLLHGRTQLQIGGVGGEGHVCRKRPRNGVQRLISLSNWRRGTRWSPSFLLGWVADMSVYPLSILQTLMV